MSNADVLCKARAIETQTNKEEMDRQQVKQSFYKTEITPEIRLSNKGLLKTVLPPYRAGDFRNVSILSSITKAQVVAAPALWLEQKWLHD
jgi:hypothetical protein